MKKLIIALLAITVVSCAQWKGDQTIDGLNFKEACIDGVTYMYIKHGYGGLLSVKYNRDSTVQTCD